MLFFDSEIENFRRCAQLVDKKFDKNNIDFSYYLCHKIENKQTRKIFKVQPVQRDQKLC
jgi:hypothetical protein